MMGSFTVLGSNCLVFQFLGNSSDSSRKNIHYIGMYYGNFHFHVNVCVCMLCVFIRIASLI